MELTEILAQLQASASYDDVAPGWEESQAAMPEGSRSFLHPDQVAANLIYCGFDPEAQASVLRTAQIIQNHAGLRQLAWHCYWRVFESPQESFFSNWPSFEDVLGEGAGIFYLLVAISMAPKVKAYHATFGLSDEITRQTLLQPRSFCLNHQMATGGKLGIPRSQLWWLRYYTCQPYFRLGRLEFWHNTYQGDYHVYRNQTHQTIVLAPGNESFDSDGFQAQDGDTRAAAWTTVFYKDEGGATGHPIAPNGRCLPQPVRLSSSKWEEVLKPGDTVLDLHIPAGGNMTPEGCKDSFLQAASLYPALFPDNPPRAVVCHSWIFSPYLEAILPANSNLVRNVMQPYLLPFSTEVGDSLWFIFYQDTYDLPSAPRATSLQRTFADYLEQGKPWRAGGMVHLLDDLPEYGNSIYRRNWPEICRELEIV